MLLGLAVRLALAPRVDDEPLLAAPQDHIQYCFIGPAPLAARAARRLRAPHQDRAVLVAVAEQREPPAIAKRRRLGDFLVGNRVWHD